MRYFLALCLFVTSFMAHAATLAAPSADGSLLKQDRQKPYPVEALWVLSSSRAVETLGSSRFLTLAAPTQLVLRAREHPPTRVASLDLPGQGAARLVIFSAPAVSYTALLHQGKIWPDAQHDVPIYKVPVQLSLSSLSMGVLLMVLHGIKQRTRRYSGRRMRSKTKFFGNSSVLIR